MQTWVKRHEVRSSLAVLLLVATQGVPLAAQDGVSANTRAKAYRAPAGSLVGAADLPERTLALGRLLQGESASALAALTKLAEGGDVASALLLGAAFRDPSRLAPSADKPKALHYFLMASREGSGEASERVAEMVERQEVAAPAEGGAAYWRALARRQGWVQQRLAQFCFDWRHGPERLHCDAVSPPGMKQLLPECPDDDAMERLRAGGVTGGIRLSGALGPGGEVSGPPATAIVLVDHAVPEEVDLQEPDAGTVIYVQQTNDRWRMLPVEAPLLGRYLILAPEPSVRGR